jgi:hypothetical protein
VRQRGGNAARSETRKALYLGFMVNRVELLLRKATVEPAMLIKSLPGLKFDKDFINTYKGAFFNPKVKGKMAFA